MSTAEIITRTSVVRRDMLGIIHGTYRIADETVDDARENVGAVRKLSNGRRALLLVDTRIVTAMPLEVRSYYASDEAADTIRALAILVGSPASRLIGNIFIGFQHSKIRTKLFTDETVAMAWLRSFLVSPDE
jgi:hypothetical protein